jgi:hypothetical protein
MDCKQDPLQRLSTYGGHIMKSLLKLVAIAVAAAAPVASFAQSNQPVTRAQVRNELIQLEHAGYNPAAADNTTYPADIQAAEARVDAKGGFVNGLGGSAGGASESGAPVYPAVAGRRSLYFGH